MRHSPRLAAGFATVTVVVLIVCSFSASHLRLKDAFEFSKNSIKHLDSSLFYNSLARESPLEPDNPRIFKITGVSRTLSPSLWGHEMEPTFSHVVNSVFPVDLIISYNDSDVSPTHEIVARYASFSPILSEEIRGHFVFVAGSACSEIDPTLHREYKGKILIMQRGKCLFVKKLHNIVGANLCPLAVVVANNVPHSGLMTMYSKTYSRDDEIPFPVLFMAYEDSEALRNLPNRDTELSIRTASFDGFVGLVLSMAVSPPLVILVCYLIIRSMQLYSRRRRNRRNQQYVRLLPVHIYNRNHLVPANHFYEYLVLTHQTYDVPLVLSAATTNNNNNDDTYTAPLLDTPLTTLSHVVGGTDLFSLSDMGILFADKDFYSTQKCSICLGRFVALKSRVLVLACKHVYHEKCLSNWLINFRKTCPLCNKPLRVSEHQPFIGHSHPDYGTFAADLEPQHESERISNTAIRSLHVNLVVSDPSASNISASVCSTTEQLTGDTLLASGSIINTSHVPQGTFVFENTVSNSDSSFVTTKTQQSTETSRASVLSSYHTSTSAIALDSGDDDETQLYESSRSTLRF